MSKTLESFLTLNMLPFPPSHDINPSPHSNTCFNRNLGPPTGHDLIWELELGTICIDGTWFGGMHVASLPVDKEDWQGTSAKNEEISIWLLVRQFYTQNIIQLYIYIYTSETPMKGHISGANRIQHTESAGKSSPQVVQGLVFHWHSIGAVSSHLCMLNLCTPPSPPFHLPLNPQFPKYLGPYNG